jgi:hypothetical protein
LNGGAAPSITCKFLLEFHHLVLYSVLTSSPTSDHRFWAQADIAIAHAIVDMLLNNGTTTTTTTGTAT